MDGYKKRHLRALHRRNLRPSTIYQRERLLVRLERHLGRRSVLRVSTEDLERFLDRLDDPSSRATERAHLRGFYGWAVEADLIARDPTAALARIRRPRLLPKPMPQPDVRRALRGAPDRIRPWLHLAAYAGLRACEIAWLRVADVHLHEKVLLIAEGKGGHMASVPLHPVLLGVLVACLPATGWAFTRADGQPLKPHNVSHGANAYLRSIGIEHTLHSLRHWFGTEIYKASGRDLRRTQELMRHRSPVSTAGYTWLDPGDGALVVAQLRA